MKDHVRIRQEYARLVRAGDNSGAQKLLEIMWGRNTTNNDKIVLDVVHTIDDIESTIKPKEITIDDLTNIKGIGKKTISDIKIMFKDIESLKRALRDDVVALRDDVVEKLKGELLN